MTTKPRTANLLKSAAFVGTVLLVLLLCTTTFVSAEQSGGGGGVEWNNVLTVGVGPTYNKYFDKAQPVSVIETKKQPKSKPKKVVKKEKKEKPTTTTTTPYGPRTPMVADETAIKAIAGVGIGLLAVPLIGGIDDGKSKSKKTKKSIPPPPLPPPAAAVTSATMTALSKLPSLPQLLPSASQLSNMIPDIPKLPAVTLPEIPKLELPSVNIRNVFKSDDPSLRNGIINLIKNIVGISVLSFPAGIAAYGSTKDAVLPGLILIGLIGILSGYGFSIIGKICCFTSSTSYKSAWSKTLGQETSWIPSLTIVCQTFMSCLAIITILSNTFSTLFDIEKKESLLGLTLLTLVPLCITSRDLKSLTPSSFVGVIGIIFTAIAMMIRLVDGNYAMPRQVSSALPDGTRSSIKVATVLTGYLADIPKFSRPSFGRRGMKNIFTTNALILVSMLSTAFLSHFNAPKFYAELENSTLPRFNSMVKRSFGVSIGIMALITAAGYCTFGRFCEGFILNNYSTKDPLMNGSRAAIALALICSFPLVFTGLRDGVMDLFNVPISERKNEMKYNSITNTLLAVLAALSAVVGDLTFPLALGGAILGNALALIYPAMMYNAVVKQQGRQGEEAAGLVYSTISALLGIVMAIIGVFVAWSSVIDA